MQNALNGTARMDGSGRLQTTADDRDGRALEVRCQNHRNEGSHHTREDQLQVERLNGNGAHERLDS